MNLIIRRTPGSCDQAGQSERTDGAGRGSRRRCSSRAGLAERYRQTVDLSSVIPWSCDPENGIVEFDEKWHALTGCPTRATPDCWSQFLHPDEAQKLGQEWLACLSRQEVWEAELRVRLRDGTYKWFKSRAVPQFSADHKVIRWHGTSEDIHDRKVAELRVQWHAEHDSLTGVLNRARFKLDLEEEMARSPAGNRFALVIIDIDDFRLVNAQMSHDAGDQLLVAVAKTLGAMSPSLARLGADQFACLVRGDDPQRSMAELLAALRTGMEESPAFLGAAYSCGITAGGAIYPEHGADWHELLKSAEIALREAKSAGRRQSKIFESGMRKALQRRSSMLSLARHALDADVLLPFYQPKVNLSSGAVEGFEALLRWDHSRLGHQLPASIWAAFEHPELGSAIGQRMLEKILADVRQWCDADVNFGRIAINVSASELVSGDYAAKLLAKMKAMRVPTSAIEIEVTERVFLGRSGEVVDRTLRALSDAGITIALDDFGTGFASLSHLTRFPVDVLKIDRCFVQSLDAGRTGNPIVDAVVGMAGALNIQTVAEGVETVEQTRWLRSCGCTLGQGFFFGKATSAVAVGDFVRSRQSSMMDF